ncbi:MAG: 50S ribosomal protein L29 [Porticoccaceae bacterium]
MKASDLREQSVESLQKVLLEQRHEQFLQRMKGATGQLDANHVMRVTRRDIARIKTVLNEKGRSLK